MEAKMRTFLFILSALMMMVLSPVIMAAEVAASVPVSDPYNIFVIVIGCLFAVSEALAQSKLFTSNSIFQFVTTVLKAINDAVKTKA